MIHQFFDVLRMVKAIAVSTCPYVHTVSVSTAAIQTF